MFYRHVKKDHQNLHEKSENSEICDDDTTSTSATYDNDIELTASLDDDNNFNNENTESDKEDLDIELDERKERGSEVRMFIQRLSHP